MSELEFNAIFSKRLKYYLHKYDMTQSELAKRLNVSTQSVTNWCKGDKSPRMDKVDAMCKIFHCKRSDFMEDRSSYSTSVSEYDIIIETQGEADLVISYRALDDVNKKKSSSYVRNLLHNQTLENELTAAHERTDVPHTKEGLQHDLDIMNDDANWQ